MQKILYENESNGRRSSDKKIKIKWTQTQYSIAVMLYSRDADSISKSF